ncbi:MULTISPECIES: helix-turn-helix transcriptional regulator [Enterobacterales]|uniref:helix-turn-helix transcriptional regulator n=1 Tax=Enterobacterales TaxID=91347 RepID=UPI002ED82A73
MTHNVTALSKNITILNDNYFYKFGLWEMISFLNNTPGQVKTVSRISSPANIIFRKVVVSINYTIPPSGSVPSQSSDMFSIDIPFFCDSLSINEIQAKLEKIISLSRIKLPEDRKKGFYQNIGAKRYLQLSSMENQVLYYVGKCYSPQSIASILGCADKTVSTHCRNAMRKMGTTKKSELYHYAAWVAQHTGRDRITLCL